MSLFINSSTNDHRYTGAVTRRSSRSDSSTPIAVDAAWTYRSSVVRVVFVWLFSSIVVLILFDVSILFSHLVIHNASTCHYGREARF